MATGNIRNIGGGGGIKQQYRYEFELYAWGVRIKKYYMGSLVLNINQALQAWNTYIWQDDIIGIYAYQDATTELRVNLIQPMVVNGDMTYSGRLYSFSGTFSTVVEYEIYRPQLKKKYLYKTGDEYTDITGGWGAVQPLQSTVNKESGAIRITAGGSANSNQRAWAITNDKVDITKAWRIGIVINNQTKYYNCVNLSGEYYVVVGWWIQGWSTNYSIQGCATAKTDNAVFSTFPYSNYQSVADGSGNYRITEVWLEE